ncbi:uncharacterized protein LOC124261733 [Haliotis rubra]|uniref:uncharacterized protein LOC124261733 n=1 Tax=Haliotis rubra TaxID=36100 RepID=UPI001EE56906|nr:uncharacterized protein LOC124261733 [Haliotis rubra]
MRSRQVPVYSGILFLSCVWIHGVDSTPAVITVRRGYTPNATVTAGRDAVLVCNGEPSEIGVWYKDGYSYYIAYIYEWSGNCNFRSNQILPRLELGSSDCREHALRISNISKIHEGRWRCTIKMEERAVNVHVVASPAETTTSRTQDSVNPQTPSVTSMTTILGGTVGGALALLAVVITVCCLLRSKKDKRNNGSARGPVNGDHRHQDPEQRKDAVMVDNVLYDSYGGD